MSRVSILRKKLTDARKRLEIKEEQIESIRRYGNNIHTWPLKEVLREIWRRLVNKFLGGF